MVKAVGPVGMHWIQGITWKILQPNEIPFVWKTGVMVLIYKKSSKKL
jgi:hypothetical protein